MSRVALRRLVTAVLLMAAFAPLSSCVSPFEPHGQDVWDAWSADAREAHRKWDRYFMGLDWDDPYHEWHDESYASGPLHR